MPYLARTAPPLLRSIRGKPHATQNDHHEPFPTPPPTDSTRSSTTQKDLTEDAINADPESDYDDEDMSPANLRNTNSKKHMQDSVLSKSSFALPTTVSLEERKSPQKGLQLPTLASSGTASSKRSADSDESDAMIFSQSSQKRRRKQEVMTNIHAVQQSRKPVGKTYTYGKNAARQRASKELKKPVGFQHAKQAQQRAQKDNLPTFRLPQGAENMSSRQTSEQGTAGAELSSSPSLSSLSSVADSAEVEEIAALDLPPPRPYVAKTECSICGKQVDKALKEDFVDQFLNGQQTRLSFKWQQRFCRHHRAHSAEQTWRERGYPDIDWSRLPERLEKCDSYLGRIISGGITSSFTGQMAKRVRTKGKDTKQQANSKSGSTGSVGYYGPRGEKVMTEYVLSNFSEQLRSLASASKLLASAGKSGGVSGFVSAVLVPELALQLVKQDMRIKDEEQAKAMMIESVELGELLHPEKEERVKEVEDEDKVSLP